jgi:hypothetical protein
MVWKAGEIDLLPPFEVSAHATPEGITLFIGCEASVRRRRLASERELTRINITCLFLLR